MAWSFDLLDEDEREFLCRCSVFAGGFDRAAAAAVCWWRHDEYEVLDQLESLVRKSLLTIEHRRGARPLRDAGDDPPVRRGRTRRDGDIADVRDRHARYYAQQVTRCYDTWDGPDQLAATDWGDVELANLRAAFRWSVNTGDIETAADIAAHTARLGFGLQRFEAIGWAEEIIDAAEVANLRRLPRVYAAAGQCTHTGRPDVALGYILKALALAGDPRYEQFEEGWTDFFEATANLFAGRIDRFIEICADFTTRAGVIRTFGLAGLTWSLPAVGRADEAMAIADEALAGATPARQPFLDRDVTLRLWTSLCRCRSRPGVVGVARRDRMRPDASDSVGRRSHHADAAQLEAVHGDRDHALALFETSIESFLRSGDYGNAAATLAYLAVCFERFDRPEIAATLYGFSTGFGSIVWVVNIADLMHRLRVALGEDSFDRCVAAGKRMEPAVAARYARDQIDLLRRDLAHR